MFIIIIGTRASGKRSIQDYLVQWKGFEALRLAPSSTNLKGVGLGLGLPPSSDGYVAETERSVTATNSEETMVNAVPESANDTTLPTSKSPSTPYSFLSLSSSVASPLNNINGQSVASEQYYERVFLDATAMLNYVTSNWRSDFVTLDITSRSLLEPFIVRPFVLVLSIDAPLMTRFNRCLKRGESVSLEEFVEDHDTNNFGSPSNQDRLTTKYISSHGGISHLHVVNSYDNLWQLHDELETLNVVNPERLRPTWDSYFMTLASLASHRSNCMKRRVGAILVRDNRIVSTGYNGTPRGVLNCNQGGCRRCNQPDVTGIEDECVCLHAEENALLEAGRERVGIGAVLYCNTCPCLKCTIKIIQTGVTEVVYNFSYKMDTSSATLFTNAGVKLRQFSPPT